MDKKAIKGLFGWLEEITTHKTSISDISEDSWKDFNAYMIHRYVSQYHSYVEIANIAQKFHYTEQKQIYSFYKEFIPKKKLWLKYVKGKSDKSNKELIESLSNYFECSLSEAKDYSKMLDKNNKTSILSNMGYNDKEIKKMLK
jgi:hypothetical protein